MKPKNASPKEAPNLNLPPPVAEQPMAAPAQGMEAQPEVAARMAPAAPEQAPSSAAAGATAAQPAIPLPTANPLASLTQTQQNDSVSNATTPTQSGVIKDNDLIEKEWVEKAKRVVEKTRNDPHQQTEQLTHVKADYLKKRYDKTLKISK